MQNSFKNITKSFFFVILGLDPSIPLPSEILKTNKDTRVKPEYDAGVLIYSETNQKESGRDLCKNTLRPSEMFKSRHSRAGGNPDGNIEVLIKQILECQAPGFPPARE
ncbi:hypothetical protein [Neisseria dentiae]|uniref:hypothetical protein n=1 Tax=Neisseria dentiae TaxID=194197 RepID=UPI00211BBADD|nr:hypothetical protein [Neisseria dentiae]MCQ9326327.1 hypothetical protein [Neisseria dentiae]